MAVGRHRAGLVDARALLVGGVDEPVDAVARGLLDHGRDIDAEALRLVDQQLVDGAVQALDQRVLHSVVDERAGGGRALLAREAERAVDEGGDDVVEVGVGVHDHAVLAAHLGHHALEVALAGGELGGRLEDAEADGAGAGERDRVDARVRDERRTDVAFPREQVERGRGHTGRVEGLDDGERTRGGLFGGLEHDAVAGREAGGDHPRGDGQGEVPGADDGHHAAGRVAQRVALARELHEPVAAFERDRLQRVELEEVDRLAHVGVGLVPRLAALADRQGGEHVASAAQLARGSRQDRRAGVCALVLPGGRGLCGRVDGGVDVLFGRRGHLRDDAVRRARVRARRTWARRGVRRR